eukprot:8886064-Pyramimonas_sp.AAC.1
MQEVRVARHRTQRYPSFGRVDLPIRADSMDTSVARVISKSAPQNNRGTNTSNLPQETQT